MPSETPAASPLPIEVAEITERPPQPLRFEEPLPPGWRLKAEGATWVAKAILWIFGCTVAIILVCGFIVIIVGTIYNKPGDAQGNGPQALIKDAVIPFIQAVATFAATIFAPLLAFILGYYFGEKGRQTGPS